MKKTLKIVSLFMAIFSFMITPLAGCKNKEEEVVIKPSGATYVSDLSYLYGICETPVELYTETDPALTAEWIAHVCKTMEIKSYRMWMHINYLFTVNEDDSLTINQEYADSIAYCIDKVKAAGVEKISLLTAERLHVAEDKNYFGTSVPDPATDYEKYMRSINVEVKAYEMIASMYPEIEYYEIFNEPDGDVGVGLTKNGYVYTWNDSRPSEFKFDREDRIKVLLDYQWYIRRGIKKGNPNAKLMTPALCFFVDTPEFVEEMYKAIYSKTLPIGEEYSDTDPDNYFDAFSWHPYVSPALGFGEYVDDDWIERMNAMRDVMVKYGDAEKPVWLTEFGFGDQDDPRTIGTVTADGQTGIAPTNYIDVLDIVKEQMSWIESVCFFRITNLYSKKVNVGAEDTFGLFYNPDDPVNKGKPKPAAVALTRYIKGGKLTLDDMKELCKCYYEAFGKIPDEYQSIISK